MPAAQAKKKKSARRLGRPPAAESAETRERILRAARSCFAEFGFAGTTNREIGARAGLTAGAIYHYFDSKVQLFAAVADEVANRIFDEFERVLVSSPDFVQRVRTLLDVAVVLHREDASLARFSTIYQVELLRHEELAAQIPVELWDRGVSFFLRLAEEALEAGELAPDVVAADVANMLLSVTTGLAQFATLDQTLERHRAAVIVVERLFDGSLMSSRGDLSREDGVHAAGGA